VDVTIPEYPGPAVTSSIPLSGCGGTASVTSRVEVHVTHTARGNLRVELLAPDGTVYLLQAPSSDTADNIHTTYEVKLSSETRDGNWRLRLRDRRAGNVGFLDSWTVTV
jgi:subtilisin-like proprotein convertase family protein